MLHCAKNNIPLGVLKTDAVVQKLCTFSKKKREEKKFLPWNPFKNDTSWHMLKWELIFVQS